MNTQKNLPMQLNIQRYKQYHMCIHTCIQQHSIYTLEYGNKHYYRHKHTHTKNKNTYINTNTFKKLQTPSTAPTDKYTQAHKHTHVNIAL